MATSIHQLESEIEQLRSQQRKLKDSASRERQKMIDRSRKELHALEEKIRKEKRQSDREMRREYDRLLTQYQNAIQSSVDESLAVMNADYARLADRTKSIEAQIERRSQELAEAIESLRQDVARKDEIRRKEAEIKLKESIKIFRQVESKPCEKFVPNRLRILYETINDGRALYQNGLYEASIGVAISAQTSLERLEFDVDDKTEEWLNNFELWDISVGYLHEKLLAEIAEWEDTIGVRASDPAGRKERMIEMNFWSRGELMRVMAEEKRLRTTAAKIKEVGTKEYLKGLGGVTTEDLIRYFEETEKLDGQFRKFASIYKERYLSYKRRADWGEMIIDFLCDEINLVYLADESGFRDVDDSVKTTRDFIDFVDSQLEVDYRTQDLREWLRLTFRNATGCKIMSAHQYPQNSKQGQIPPFAIRYRSFQDLHLLQHRRFLSAKKRDKNNF